MERMDMHSRDEYLKVMRKSYIKARSRKEREETYWAAYVTAKTCGSGYWHMIVNLH